MAAIEAEINLARSELQAARTWPNPELSVERVSPDRSRSELDETNFMLSQQFELGGRRGLQRRAAELGISAAEAFAAAERQRVRLEVLRQYYGLVVAEQRAASHRAWIGMLEELARVAAHRASAGDLAGYESRRIQQVGALARIRLQEIEATLAAAREQLAGMMGIESGRIELSEHIDLLPATKLFEGRPGAAPATGVNSNAELAALDAHRTAAAAAAKAAERTSLPVTLGVGQRRVRGPLTSDEALVLALSVPLPLFDRNQAVRARAEAEALRADSRYRIRLRGTQARVEAARAEAAQLTAAALHLRTEILPQTKALTRSAQSSFAEGELELTGLLSAFDAEFEVVNQSLELAHRARTLWLELEQLTQPDPLPSGEMP